MASRPYEGMSRTELLREVIRLGGLLDGEAGLAALAHELEVQREELSQQQAQLIESQRQIETSRDRYVELFDFAPIGHVVTDASGLVLDINLTGARLLGTERAHVIGYPLHSFLTERRPFLDYLSRCARSAEPVESEMTLRPRNGPAVPVQLTAKRSTTVSDQEVAFHVAVVDLSERKRVERERSYAEQERRRMEQDERVARAASEAKDRFIAVLSHELRTPLTPIVLALATLERAGVVPPTLSPTLDMIRRNVRLEARLIDDLLDVTRITQGKLTLASETVDAHVIVEEVVSLCDEEIRAAGVRVSLELGAPAHHVRGDDTRLRQVVWNLLRNAVHYTPAGGSVRVTSTNESPDRLTLTVADSGAGIAPELLGRIFRPFEQGTQPPGQRGGLGLGLAICKGIVDAHGGRIQATSEGEGSGAQFTVELLTVRQKSRSASAPRRPVHPVTAPKRILLVEDHPDNAVATAELLRAHGFEVEVAGSVRSALALAPNGFDVLVSDIGLPDGSGRDLVRQLSERGPIPCIALTGYGSDDDVRRNTEAGFTRHLTKPVDADDLVAAITGLTVAMPAEFARAARTQRRS